MKIQFTLLSCLCTLFISTNLFAQDSWLPVNKKQMDCALDAYIQNQLQIDPSYQDVLDEQEILREEIAFAYANGRSTANPCPNGEIIVPVAIHYDTGMGTNPAQQACLTALANQQIQALNQAFNGITDDFCAPGSGANSCTTTSVNGACLTFILATQSHPAGSGLANGDPAITFDGDYTCPIASPCNITPWAGYLNIVVQDMSGAGGVLGVAPLNGNPNAGGAANSVVSEITTFGTTGVNCIEGGPDGANQTTYNNGFVTTHEVGHWFGLPHTFCQQGPNGEDGETDCTGCGANPNCDGFTDTPPQCYQVFGCTAPCSGSQTNPCGGTAVFNNWMDYSPGCSNSFTDQQNNAMNVNANNDNFDLTTVAGTIDAAPICDFEASLDQQNIFLNGNDIIACNGSALVFYESTTSSPCDYNWTFAGGGGVSVSTTSSNDPNPKVFLTGTDGTVTVTYNATNAIGGCPTVTKTYNVFFSFEIEPDIDNVNCIDATTAEVPLDIMNVAGNLTFTPNGIINGSGTAADPYTVTVDLSAGCQPIEITGIDDGISEFRDVFEITSPGSIAGTYPFATNAQDEWGIDPTTVSPCAGGQLVLTDDGTAPVGDFCQPTPPATPSAAQCAGIAGNIAVIDRGACNFTDKVENAQACGAIAVIICNCEVGATGCSSAGPNELVTMSGTPSSPVTIPSIFLTYEDCIDIKMEMSNGPVEACIGSPVVNGCEKTVSIDLCNISCALEGCTDPCADNFDPNALTDDGSCAPYDTSCNSDCTLGDITVWNADNCACEVETTTVEGCTDMAACNFDANANCDDDSCIIETACDTDPCTNGGTTVWSTATCSCVPDETTVDGCTDNTACNFNPNANCDDDSCLPAPTCNTDPCLGDIEQIDPNNACACILVETQVNGCTDNTACNYNPSANCDDDSCIIETTCDTDPCTNGGIFIWDVVTCACIIDEATVDGCTDNAACNYNPNANCDDDSCIIETACDVDPCSNGGIYVWNDINCACELQEATVNGCTDNTACNYNSNANCDDSSCQAVPVCNTDPCLGDVQQIDTNDACTCILVEAQIDGCTDPTACNFNPDANCDNGSCLAPPVCNTDPCAGDLEQIDANDPCNCVVVETQVIGCTVPGSCNYNPAANCDDDSCLPTPVCNTDPCMGDITIVDVNNPCDCIIVEAQVLGCTDNTACNYNPLANCDDDSCISAPVCNSDPCLGNVEQIDPNDACACILVEEQINGCTDDTACNYNPSANCDDDSCIAAPVCNTDPCTGDVFQVDPNDPCECVFVETQVNGCTDPTASNYNEDANCNDGTCENVIPGCTDMCADNFDASANFDDGSCNPYDIFCNTDCTQGDLTVWDPMSCSCVLDTEVILGCTIPEACNYNPNANCDDESCIAVICNTDPCLGDITQIDPNDPCECIILEPQVVGCMDVTACNFDSNANCDDGNSCLASPVCNIDPCLGDIEQINPNNTCECITVDPQILGCTDNTACNFDVTANCDDSSCIFESTCDDDICTNGGSYVWSSVTCACVLNEATVNGCTDATQGNYNPAANCDDGTCSDAIFGCIDPCADNYNANANTDDGSCNAYDTTCNDDCLNGDLTVWNSNTCACEVQTTTVVGCTDMDACNFNSAANCDDGSCIMAPVCNTDPCLGNIESINPNNACECIVTELQYNGCTDATANNYLPIANCDDGTCVYPIEGCTDPCAPNFDATADTDDGTCEDYIINCNDDCTNGDLSILNPVTCNCDVQTTIVQGCTDPNSCNYNAAANCDDGSCAPVPTCNTDPCMGDIEMIDPTDLCQCIVEEAQLLGCTDANADNYDANANCDDGTCTFTILGCTDICADNYNANANSDDGSCNPYDTACNNDCTQGDLSEWNASSCSCEVITVTVNGCTEAAADNYNANANCDDGSCTFTIEGCTDACSDNYNPNATTDDGTCNPYDTTCNDDCLMGNVTVWDPAVCSCVISVETILGCTDDAAFNYNPIANCEDGSCQFGTPGCTDACAPNYNPFATVDDLSCEPYDTTCNDDCTLGDITFWAPGACQCIVSSVSVQGCTDANADNFNPDANCDDGSCVTSITGCTDPCAPNFDSTATVDDGTCEAYDSTCNDDCLAGDITAWDVNTCSCELVSVSVIGCTDSAASNYNPDANCNDGSCDNVITGCTDPCADNFNSAANFDDGSCNPYDTTCNDDCLAGDITVWDATSCSCIVSETVILGCTDANADNYNPDANCDDSSCANNVFAVDENSSFMIDDPCVCNDMGTFDETVYVSGPSGLLVQADANSTGINNPVSAFFNEVNPGEYELMFQHDPGIGYVIFVEYSTDGGMTWQAALDENDAQITTSNVCEYPTIDATFMGGDICSDSGIVDLNSMFTSTDLGTIESYSLDDGSSSNTISGSTFDPSTLQIGNTYTLTVTLNTSGDGNNGTTTSPASPESCIVASLPISFSIIDCNTGNDCNAGVLSSSQQYVCAGGAVSAASAGFEIGTNLMIMYVLHDGSDAGLGTVFNTSTTGFFANDGSLPTNTDLCITAVIGEPNQGSIPSNICSISNCLPVVFLEPVQIISEVTCDPINGNYAVNFVVNGGAPAYNTGIYSYQIDGTYPVTSASVGEFFTFGPLGSGESYEILVLNDGVGCNANYFSGPINCEVEFDDLPIELISFNGEAESKGNLLSWQTATEINNDYFTLEISNNGEEFEMINRQEGAGTSSIINEYSYFDEEIKNGITYYRLTQTDFDGSSEIVGVVTIKRNDRVFEVSEILPVPASNFIEVQVNAEFDKAINYQIYNAIGQVVQSSVLNANNNSNAFTIPLENFEEGIYFISVNQGINSITKKFIVE